VGVNEEAYRVLRSNLIVAMGNLERPSVIVTSAYAGEGKTATAVHLSKALARSGKRVVLVDFDLHHPDTHRWLSCHNEFGTSDVLLERRSLDESLQYVEVGMGASEVSHGLYLLSAGTGVQNPAELLGTRRTAQLLEALARQADIVLIDTPPVLLVADTLGLCRMVGGAILVVEARKTPIVAVNHAKDAIIRNQGRLLGMVLNKLPTTGQDYGYGYGYGYGARNGGGEGDSE
jgi:capsular exopolysaccharide synthesis family protein